MNKLNLITAACAAAILVACGGGGGSTPVASVNTSQFIDSPVQGLYYVATPSGQTGTTDASGNFTFKDGDTVSFKIGGSSGLEIASTSPVKDAPVLVTDLPAGAQVAQILQSLDLGNDPSAKLDLSLITSLPSSTVTALKAHIENAGDLSSGQTLLANAQTAIQSANTSLASKTFPTPKSSSEVQSHLEASLAKVTPKLPAVDGKTYLMVSSYTNQPKDYTLIGFRGSNVKFMTHHLGVVTGTYSQSGDVLTTTLTGYKEYGADTTQSVNCGKSSKLGKMIIGGFTATTTSTGTDCANDPASTDSVYLIDPTLKLSYFSGKKFDLTSTDSNFTCPSTWEFGTGTTSLTLKSTPTDVTNCKGLQFQSATVTPLASEASFIFVVDVTYGNIGGTTLDGKFFITKISGTDQFGLLYASNFTPSSDNSSATPDGEFTIKKAAGVNFTAK